MPTPNPLMHLARTTPGSLDDGRGAGPRTLWLCAATIVIVALLGLAAMQAGSAVTVAVAALGAGAVTGWLSWSHHRRLALHDSADAALLDDVIDGLAVGVLILDGRRRVIRANAIAAMLFGGTPTTLVREEPGVGDATFLDQDGQPLDVDELPSSLAMRGVTVNDRLLGLDVDGVRHWIHATSVLLAPSEDHRAPRALLTIVDVTRRVALDSTAEAERTQLRHRALHDSLTGLPNRTVLMDRLSHAQQTARRRKTSTGMLVIDLDGFKAVNDTLGHAAGDEVLVQVAVRLRSTMRASDTAARLGGDEFVVLCEDLDPTHGAEAMQMIGGRIEELLNEAYFTSSGPAAVGASVGWSLAAPGAPVDLDLIAAADEQMLEVKRARRETHDRHAPMRPAKATATDGRAGHELRVVIVDDDPAMRLLAERIVESSGTGVEVVGSAGDGRTAVRMILDVRPDLVLCDVMMPGMSGPEVVSKVRAHIPDQRFVFWSATASRDLEQHEATLSVPFVLKDRIEQLPEKLTRLARALEAS